MDGAIDMQPSDLAPAIARMSPLFRIRWLVVLWMAWYAVSMTLRDAPRQMLGPLLVSAVVVTFLFLSPRLTARRLVHAIAKDGRAHVSYHFDAEGITIDAAGAVTTFPYRKLVRVREIKTAFLLYAPLRITNVIPKRAFSEGDLSRVRAFLAASPHSGA